MGPFHQQLERLLIDYLAVKNISLFTNGHAALCIALKALGIKGEVITTPFTFVSTVHAITQNNLKAVFCDINPDDYTMDVTKLEGLINERTSAIIPVHVYGNVCNVDKIEYIARKYNLKVIYDAAHAFGVTMNGRGIGTFGDISMFSFHATKVFNTIEGGALTFPEECYRRKFNNLKNFGITSPETVEEVGTNAKMNEFQAIMGICNLRYIDYEITKRRIITERYRERLGGITGIKLLREQKGVKANYSYFPVLFDGSIFGRSRDEVFDTLKDNNIYTRKYFYPLINELNCYKGDYSLETTPIARKIASEVLTLPLYSDLKLEDVDRICDCILK
jgi:dTDP-4-amino-4,6-dideoxygalactose transaminase